MDDLEFRLLGPAERMAVSGERSGTGMPGDIRHAHHHRYLFARRFCPGRDVLDVASGVGHGSVLLADIARSVVGVEIDEGAAAVASQVHGRENLTLRSGSATALPLADASVDVVISFAAIGRTSEHAGFLAEATRVLRQGGILLISMPESRISKEALDALLRARFAHVAIYEQQILEGSVLARPTDGEGAVESFSTTDGGDFTWRQGLPRATHLLAVASHQALALPAASLLSDPPTGAAATTPMAPAAPPPSLERMLHLEKHELSGNLVNERLRVAGLERRLYEMDRERGYLRAMITGARERNDIAYAEQSRARAALEQEAATLKQQAVAANAAFAAQIEAIRTSTSWRLTGPMRVIVRALRRFLR